MKRKPGSLSLPATTNAMTVANLSSFPLLAQKRGSKPRGNQDREAGMIYLKFCGTQNDGPITERVFCVKDYSVSVDDVGLRIYVEPGQWERVSENDWLNCFVMSDSGKTIDRYDATIR